MQNVKITTQPAIEPVAVFEAKAYMRVDISDDDEVIADMILAARELAEQYTRRKFITTGITLTLDSWPCKMNNDWWDGAREAHVNVLNGSVDSVLLPYPPALSIASVTTYDIDNTSAVFSSSNYRLDAVGGRLYLNSSAVLPINLRSTSAIDIVYTCGYGATPDSVPSAIKHAIKMTVAAMYDNRECFELPMAAKSALNPYRIIEERVNYGV